MTINHFSFSARRVLIGVVALAMLSSGCALFRGDPVPPLPPRPGVSLQTVGPDKELQGKLRRDETGKINGFEPLNKARAQVKQASANAPEGEDSGAAALVKASQQLETAEQAWRASGDSPDAALLAKVNYHSYLASRWAQIAEAEAGRESGLSRLDIAQRRLNERDAADSRWLGSYLVPQQFGNLGFTVGTARLTDDSAPVMRKLVDFMRNHPRYGLRISGHTDDQPPSSPNLTAFLEDNPRLAEAELDQADVAALYNLAVSKRRAEAVKNALVEQGVAADRLDVFAFGQSRPLVSNDSAAGRRKNRRVEVLVVRADEAREQAGAATFEPLQGE